MQIYQPTDPSAQDDWERIVDLYIEGRVSKEELDDPNINMAKILIRIFEEDVLSGDNEEK